MPPKSAARSKAAVDDELGELFEGIGVENAPKKTTTKAKPAAASSRASADIDDVFAELQNQIDEKPKTSSRPETPRVKETGTKRPAGAPPAAADKADDKTIATPARKSAESAPSSQPTTVPNHSPPEVEEPAAAAPQPAPAASGGWWGGFIASASATAAAAVKQAETAARQLQQSEEAKKWAEQVRGNVGAIRGFVGEEIRHRALPTFSDLIHTLAPPIASHERLAIHITHDLVGYPSLDPLVYGVFSRVMAQVEGGDLMVIQRGQENTVRPARPSSSASAAASAFFSAGQSVYGWRDGPWWRASDMPRDMGTIKGLAEGTKLCRASAEAYASEYFAAKGGIDLARQRAVEPVSEDNPVRSSDLFLALQAIKVDASKDLFAGSPAAEAKAAEGDDASDVHDDGRGGEEIVFAIFVLDPVHDISFSTVSQAVPEQWVCWLDASTPLTPTSSGGDELSSGGVSAPDSEQAFLERVPEEIRDVVESGGVDPREWVAEWIEELLNLAIGIVAQRYVARRMGVGIGAIGKGKRNVQAVVGDGGCEAARAGLI
ncbi:hypothetical protein PpBr36_03295 [Pyricularia pennisetigena]|uniref:hypothetical protein n=1 Tax=Pyricularia pennisetigena TaxID=1578925 RepID=UPI001151D413|nr:hypothetical protein PpBr36_03295 [Pyricularia pennisetigena]TLS30067.1 hypothetical protein PpBr36_03295 [Pyricularia pennisetigena]